MAGAGVLDPARACPLRRSRARLRHTLIDERTQSMQRIQATCSITASAAAAHRRRYREALASRGPRRRAPRRADGEPGLEPGPSRQEPPGGGSQHRRRSEGHRSRCLMSNSDIRAKLARRQPYRTSTRTALPGPRRRWRVGGPIRPWERRPNCSRIPPTWVGVSSDSRAGKGDPRRLGAAFERFQRSSAAAPFRPSGQTVHHKPVAGERCFHRGAGISTCAPAPRPEREPASTRRSRSQTVPCERLGT